MLKKMLNTLLVVAVLAIPNVSFAGSGDGRMIWSSKTTSSGGQHTFRLKNNSQHAGKFELYFFDETQRLTLERGVDYKINSESTVILNSKQFTNVTLKTKSRSTKAKIYACGVLVAQKIRGKIVQLATPMFECMGIYLKGITPPSWQARADALIPGNKPVSE